MITTRVLSAAVVLASASLLAGCSSVDFAPEVGSTPTEAVVVTPEPVGIVAGAEVTAEQARQINDDTKDNAKAYPLPDGRWVIVVKDQPVPDVVAADGGEKSWAAAQEDAANGPDYHKGLEAAAKRYAAETGKRVVHVKRPYTADFVNGGYGYVWTIGDIDDPGPCGTRETCVAKAEAWIAKQHDPASWTVLASAD